MKGRLKMKRSVKSKAVVGRLADYLKQQDPTLRGYGKSNLDFVGTVP